VIIRRLPRAFLFIAQQDHAALSAALMDEWQLDGLREHPRRDAILLATREHDNGWLEEDAMTHVDANGEPLDFISVPPAVKQRIWPRASLRLADTAPYAGVLIAQHALALHGQQESEPAWRPFLARMERIKAELLTRCTPGAAATVLDDYRFLQAGDQLSLIFCNGWTAPFPRPGGRVALEGTTLVATPDPFGGRRIPLRVPARRLDLQTFPTNRALRQALDATDVEYLIGEAASTVQ
jgi:hypothetical protein